MWLSGLGAILQGIPLLFFYGLGIISIILGIFYIKFGNAIFKMKKSAYAGAMVLIVIGIVFTILHATFFAGGVNGFNNETVVSIVGNIFFIVVLYAYREKFVN